MSLWSFHDERPAASAPVPLVEQSDSNSGRLRDCPRPASTATLPMAKMAVGFSWQALEPIL